MKYLTVVLAIAASPGIVLPAQQQPTFKTGVELVSVPVSVTTRNRNAYIDGLTVADFDVSENGERQVVQTLTRDRRPVSICFVVDASASMERGMRTEIARQAGRRLAGQLLPEDEMAIVLLTDGFENASRESASSIVKTRRQSETTVYGIGIVQTGVAEQQRDRVYEGLAMPDPDGSRPPDQRFPPDQ